MMNTFLEWLHSTTIAQAMTLYKWTWPTCESLHFIGMALLIGVVGALDLRMLGIAKNVSFEPLHRLLPWGIAGFVINLVTGALFFAGDPFQYVNNVAFYLKLIFIALAGINVLVFYYGPFEKIKTLGPGQDAPGSAKLIAATSLFLWFGVMFWGRMLPFIGNAF